MTETVATRVDACTGKRHERFITSRTCIYPLSDDAVGLCLPCLGWFEQTEREDDISFEEQLEAFDEVVKAGKVRQSSDITKGKQTRGEIRGGKGAEIATN